MTKLFQEILQDSKKAGSKSPTTKQAIDWLRKQALQVKTANPKSLIDDAGPFKRLSNISQNSIGKMYMFSYDPKHKDILPYYDNYPLIFPVEMYSDSFLGINLHYLPPMLRAKLMDALMSTINNKKYDKTTKLVMSYQILKSASKFKYFEPCLKKYLFNHVKSPFVYIAPDEWNIALMLPTERFVGASKSQVFKDSTSMVR
jgi:hypothetical protein